MPSNNTSDLCQIIIVECRILFLYLCYIVVVLPQSEEASSIDLFPYHLINIHFENRLSRKGFMLTIKTKNRGMSPTPSMFPAWAPFRNSSSHRSNVGRCRKGYCGWILSKYAWTNFSPEPGDGGRRTTGSQFILSKLHLSLLGSALCCGLELVSPCD